MNPLRMFWRWWTGLGESGQIAIPSVEDLLAGRPARARVQLREPGAEEVEIGPDTSIGGTGETVRVGGQEFGLTSEEQATAARNRLSQALEQLRQRRTDVAERRTKDVLARLQSPPPVAVEPEPPEAAAIQAEELANLRESIRRGVGESQQRLLERFAGQGFAQSGPAAQAARRVEASGLEALSRGELDIRKQRLARTFAQLETARARQFQSQVLELQQLASEARDQKQFERAQLLQNQALDAQRQQQEAHDRASFWSNLLQGAVTIGGVLLAPATGGASLAAPAALGVGTTLAAGTSKGVDTAATMLGSGGFRTGVDLPGTTF